jgi:hypothetical protein
VLLTQGTQEIGVIIRNIYHKMEGQLRDARNHLKRLSGKTAEAYEALISRTEEQLENWWSGGGE